MIRTIAIATAAAAVILTGPCAAGPSSSSAAWTTTAARPPSSCIPLVLRYWNIDKRVVDGPGGPSDPTIFVAAGLHYKRGCHITSGRATLALQFRYHEHGRYIYRTIPNATVSAELKGSAHTLFNLLLPKDREPNCTGTRGHYRIKLNLSPGTVVFRGKVYHIAPEVDFYPAGDNGQEGKWVDCRTAAS